MRPITRPTWARVGYLSAALIVAAAGFMAPAGAQTHKRTSTLDGITPHINAVLHDPEVVRHIRSWGLTIVDVQHDVDAMSPQQRAELAVLLNRRWQGTDSQPPEALQAQFLVMMSLMRESTLFASVITTGPTRLLR